MPVRENGIARPVDRGFLNDITQHVVTAVATDERQSLNAAGSERRGNVDNNLVQSASADADNSSPSGMVMGTRDSDRRQQERGVFTGQHVSVASGRKSPCCSKLPTGSSATSTSPC